MRRYFLVVLLSAVMLMGCAVDPAYGGASVFSLLIDWEYIDRLEDSGRLKTPAGTSISSLPPVNHVGVRLVVPDSQGQPAGVYVKSLKRGSKEESIAFEVQPTSSAYLQIVMVHTPEVWGTGPHYLYYVGVIRDLAVRADTFQSYTLDDGELYNPMDQWELLPPWNGLEEEGEIILEGNQEYSFRWQWKDGSPMPVRGQDPQMVSVIDNFGRQMEDGGWYDYGGSNKGYIFKAPASGEWTVGFLLWVSGDRYGLSTQSYYVPSTVRDGDCPNTRWKITFAQNR